VALPMCRVLSLDGGGQLEMTSALLLQEIEMRRPGFLKCTDVFAGTSAGAFVSLILATRDDPAPLLPETETLWEKFLELSMNGPFGTMLGIVGLGAIFTNTRLREYLGQERLLGDKTLADLRKRVVVPCFRLDHTNKLTGDRTWRPKVYHNFGRAENPDFGERAVDVALRSGAAPIMFPVVDGFVDGGLVANHPALVAISAILNDWMVGNEGATAGLDHAQAWKSKQQVAESLRVLSIGVGEDQRYVPIQDANWGWFNWVLNPFNPLLAIDAMLKGDMAAVDYECRRILPKGRYFRLNPHFVRQSPIPFMVNTDVIRKTVMSDETQQLVERTITWIDNSGWLEAGPAAPE
jgi:uncharacterized protein